MKLSIEELINNGYIEYSSDSIKWKNYITSFRKSIGSNIVIDVDVIKSIRGGLLYNIRYVVHNGVLVDSIITKHSTIYMIENIAINILESTRKGKI